MKKEEKVSTRVQNEQKKTTSLYLKLIIKLICEKISK